jgi:hypothetical protein
MKLATIAADRAIHAFGTAGSFFALHPFQCSAGTGAPEDSLRH